MGNGFIRMVKEIWEPIGDAPDTDDSDVELEQPQWI